RSRPEGKAQRAVAIVRKEPIIASLQREGRGHSNGFMTGTGNLEKDFLLSLEGNLPVVHTPGHTHVAIEFDQLFAAKPFVVPYVLMRIAFACGQFGIRFCRRHPIAAPGLPTTWMHFFK